MRSTGGCVGFIPPDLRTRPGSLPCAVPRCAGMAGSVGVGHQFCAPTAEPLPHAAARCADGGSSRRGCTSAAHPARTPGLCGHSVRRNGGISCGEATGPAHPERSPPAQRARILPGSGPGPFSAGPAPARFLTARSPMRRDGGMSSGEATRSEHLAPFTQAGSPPAGPAILPLGQVRQDELPLSSRCGAQEWRVRRWRGHQNCTPSQDPCHVLSLGAQKWCDD